MNQKFPTVKILQIPVFSGSRERANAYITKRIENQSTAIIFTPNPEILWQAHKDKALFSLLSEADLLLPDGVGVTLAARLRGTPMRERITGIDTGEWLLRYAAEHAHSVFLLGGKEGVAERAKNALCQKIPTLKICGTHHGYFDKRTECRENQAVLQKIRDAQPDFLFVCFGFPAQERWISENAEALPFLRVAIGLGGALDVWSGNIKRAPKMIQKCGMEWLWRAAREPKRVKRLLCLPRFLWASVRQK